MNESQMDFRAVGSGATQTDRLLGILSARPGEWHSMVDLGHAIGAWAVGSRCADLRKRGYCVENMQRVDPVTRQRLSWYRLVGEGTEGTEGT